jgi:hypothetical protein
LKIKDNSNKREVNKKIYIDKEETLKVRMIWLMVRNFNTVLEVLVIGSAKCNTCVCGGETRKTGPSQIGSYIFVNIKVFHIGCQTISIQLIIQEDHKTLYNLFLASIQQRKSHRKKIATPIWH